MDIVVLKGVGVREYTHKHMHTQMCIYGHEETQEVKIEKPPQKPIDTV